MYQFFLKKWGAFMFQTKRYVAAVVTALLLMVSMIFTACGGGGDEKKDAAHKDKPIEITDVTGQTVTLKKPAERVLLQWSGSGGAFITMAAIMGKDLPNVIAGLDSSLMEYRADMWSRFKTDLPALEKIPPIGSVSDKTFNAEQAIALNPDVIFIPLDLKEQYESDAKENWMLPAYRPFILTIIRRNSKIISIPSMPLARLLVKRSVQKNSNSFIQST